jgi:hypothetical protein
MKRDEWAKHVAAWKRSGKTADEYGSPRGILGKRLQWWNWYLRRQPATLKSGKAKCRSVELLPVTLRSSAPPPSMVVHEAGPSTRVEIVLPNGSVIRAEPPVDAGWLGRLVLVAGDRAC